MTYSIRHGEYNGHKTMSIDKVEVGKRPFSFTFGRAKAEAVIANIGAIKAFMAETAPIATPPEKVDI